MFFEVESQSYDENGFVTMKWRNIICDLENRDVVITSGSLIKAYHNLTSHGRICVINSSQQTAEAKIRTKTETVAHSELKSEMSVAEEDVLSPDQAVKLLLRSRQVGQLLDLLVTNRQMSTAIDRRPNIEQPVLPVGVLVS